MVFALFLGACSDEKLSEKLQNASKDLKLKYAAEIDKLISLNISNVKKLADNETLKAAFRDEDQGIAARELIKFSDSVSSYEDLKFHAHTKDIRSFVRHWNIDVSGDDLAYFRHSIKYAKKRKDIIVGFEVGRIGLTLRAISPVMDGDEYLGSIESILGLDSVVAEMAKQGETLLFFMNGRRSAISDMLQDRPAVHGLVLSQKDYNPEVLDILKDLDIFELYTEDYIVRENYLITAIEIDDISTICCGLVVLAKHLDGI